MGTEEDPAALSLGDSSVRDGSADPRASMESASFSRDMAERVGFEPAGRRKLKELQRTGSDLKQCKFMKNHRTGFRGFQRVSAFFATSRLLDRAADCVLNYTLRILSFVH